MKSSESNHNQIHVTISMPDGRPLGIWINSFDELDEEIERIHKRWYKLEQKKNYNHIVLKEKCPRCGGELRTISDDEKEMRGLDHKPCWCLKCHARFEK